MAYVQHIFSPWYHLIPLHLVHIQYIMKYIVFYIGIRWTPVLIYNYQLILYTYGEDDACVFFFHINAEIMVSSPHFRELSVHTFSSDRKV